MEDLKQIQEFFSKPLDEVTKSQMLKKAKKGSYPATLVAIENGKVVAQEKVSTPQEAPAAHSVMSKKYPNANIRLEDSTGKILEEGKQLDIEDFAKVVQAVTQTGHPATVLLVPKFNEIEIITGMDAPDDMLRDLSNAVDSLGYGRNDIIIAGDSSNLSRREYSDIRRVNGGHKDYFEESLNEVKRPEPDYKQLVKLLIMAFKHEPKARFYFNRNNGVIYFDLIGGAAYSPKKSKMRDIFGGMNPIAVNREFGRADHYEEETIKQVEQLSNGKIKAEIKELGDGVLYKLASVNEATKEEEGTSIELKPVGRDTGVKLNLRAIKKHLEKNGYTVNYSKGSSMVNPKVIDVFNPNTGNSIVIARNGELFGDGNWGVEVSTDKEAIQALKQFENELNESKPLKENTFKVGQEVTYLGHPAVVTATKEYNGRNFVSVSYDKGTGKRKASNILATSGDVKPLNEGAVEIMDAYNDVMDLVKKHSRTLSDDDSYAFGLKLKAWFDKNILEENKKLTYNNFIQMVRDDMMAGAAPDEYPSDERVRKDAKYLYNRYLQGASIEDLFEATKEEENEFHKKLDKLVHKTFGHSSDEKKYKKGDKLKIKLKNGKEFDVIFDKYLSQDGMAFGKIKDEDGEFDTKPFALNTVVEYNTGIYYHPDKEKSSSNSKKSSLKKVKDMIKRAVKEGDITVDDKTEFKLNLKHLLDKHIIQKEDLSDYEETEADYDKLYSNYAYKAVKEVFEEKGFSKYLKSKDNPKGETDGLTPDVLNKILMNVVKDIKETNQIDEASKGALNYFNDLKYYYQKAFRYLDVEEREEYKQLAKDFFSRLQIDDKVRSVGLEESSSSEEKRIAMSAIKRIAKYRGVEEDEARNDLIRAAKELGSLKEAIKEIFETIELGKQLEEGKLCPKGEAYRKRRMAAGEKSSAYLSGRAVKVCKGQMSGKKKK